MAYTTIDDPAIFFNTVLYTGDIVDGDGTGHDQSITGVGFQPDFVWHKGRSAARQHIIVDSVRGTGGGSAMLGLSSQDNNAESNANTNGWIESIDSNGITVTSGNDSSSKSNNAGANGNTYVVWNWKESATAGFDIVSYTGNGTSGATVNHGLGVAPNWYMVKRRNTTGSWYMYHSANTSAPATDFLYLNETYATEDGVQAWNDTAPTSSVFSLGDNENVNNNTSTYIAYLWAQKKGFSKFGSYIGNGSVTDSDTAVDGTFVYTGFKPAWIMWKISSDNGGHWVMVDNKRSPFNKTTAGQSNGEPHVLANVGNAEGSTEAHVDLLSNGFKFRSSSNNNFNYTGKTYVYMAFAESPFVNSKGIPTNAR